MKPLSERLKDFPNAQFVDWLCLACVDVREVRTPDDAQEEINKIRDAVTGRLASLMQRAEAAEAKLAELEQQEPVAYVHPAYLQAGALGFDASVGRLAPAQIPLFTRPAPAVDLADLLPPKKELVSDTKNLQACEWGFHLQDEGWNKCIDAVIKNIEARKK